MELTQSGLNLVCQQLAERGEDEALIRLSRLSQETHDICHRYLPLAIAKSPFPARSHLEKIILNVDIKSEQQRNFYLTLYKFLMLGQQYNLKVMHSLSEYVPLLEMDQHHLETCQKILTRSINLCQKDN